MKQVTSISLDELRMMSKNMYDGLVKVVADIRLKKVAIDAEMHVDEEQLLLEDGSKQEDLWSFNVYPDKYGTDEFIEYDSMINIRPSQNNNSRSIESTAVQKSIVELLQEVVHE